MLKKIKQSGSRNQLFPFESKKSFVNKSNQEKTPFVVMETLPLDFKKIPVSYPIEEAK